MGKSKTIWTMIFTFPPFAVVLRQKGAPGFFVLAGRSKAALRLVNSKEESTARSFALLRMTTLKTTAKNNGYYNGYGLLTILFSFPCLRCETWGTFPFALLRDDNLKIEGRPFGRPSLLRLEMV
jgi:hypothetical protein